MVKKNRRLSNFVNYDFDIYENVFVDVKHETVLEDPVINTMGIQINTILTPHLTFCRFSIHCQHLLPDTYIFILKLKEMEGHTQFNLVRSFETPEELEKLLRKGFYISKEGIK